jgi:hypothetical protein
VSAKGTVPAAPSSPLIASFAKLGPVDVDDVADLRHYLSWVPDPRAKRGRWYSLANLLTICAAAVLAGATTVEAVVEWAADAPASILKALGVRRHPLGWRRSPSRRCLVSLLSRIEDDALDRAVCAWLADCAAFARVKAVKGESSLGLEAVAVDGKTLRGSKGAAGHRVHLLSAVSHDSAHTLAQRDVGTKTVVGSDADEFKWACDQVITHPEIGFGGEDSNFTAYVDGTAVHSSGLPLRPDGRADWNAIAVPELTGVLLPAGLPVPGRGLHYGFFVAEE